MKPIAIWNRGVDILFDICDTNEEISTAAINNKITSNKDTLYHLSFVKMDYFSILFLLYILLSRSPHQGNHQYKTTSN